MKKLVTLSMLLVLSIVGLIFGYKNLEMDEIFEDAQIKIPFLSDEQPVASNVMTIVKPFKNNNVEVAVSYYDGTKDNQEKSIIVIDKTFIPNKGILYRSDKEFEVVAIYDGTVLEVGKDDLTGNYVKVTHNDNIIATYKILNDIKVKKGDYIKKGDMIGHSGTSQIATGNLLLFELEVKNSNVNPEEYYNKTIKEI